MFDRRTINAALFTTLAPPFWVAACGRNERERFLILETPPFWEGEWAYEHDRVDAVVDVATRFAERHEMDLLLSRESLGPGEFQVIAAGPFLNLTATHLSMFGPRIKIFATSRGDPTSESRMLLEEFRGDVLGAAAPG